MSGVMSKEEIDQVRKYALCLSEYIRRADKTIRINAGEGYLIYNHPEVKSAFREVRNKKVDIKIVIGPVVFIEPSIRENRIYRENGLLELAEEGVISLYKRTRRTGGSHYRIFDDGEKGFLVEKPHPILGPFSEREFEDKNDVSAFCKKFDESIEKGEVSLSKDPYNDFLLLSYGEIVMVREKVEQDGKKFDDLTREEIEKYL